VRLRGGGVHNISPLPPSIQEAGAWEKRLQTMRNRRKSHATTVRSLAYTSPDHIWSIVVLRTNISSHIQALPRWNCHGTASKPLGRPESCCFGQWVAPSSYSRVQRRL